MKLKTLLISLKTIFMSDKNQNKDVNKDNQIYTKAEQRNAYFIFNLLRIKNENNNYLLTGNKVALFSPRQTRDILLPER